MRGSMRRAQICWQRVGQRYSAYLQSLTDDEFLGELRRQFTGFTREQFVAHMRGEDVPDRADAEGSSSELLDKLFEGRDRL